MLWVDLVFQILNMSLNSAVLKKTRNLLARSKKVLICINNTAKYDTHAAAVALTLYLKDLGKSVAVCSNGELSGTNVRLFQQSGVEYQKDLTPLSYVITLDHADGAVDKVSFDDKDGKFYLYIVPSADGKPFDFKRVKYSQGGSDYDTVIVFGARELNWLGDIYKNNRKLFEKCALININNLDGEQKFGEQLVDPGTSVSEIVFGLFEKSSTSSADKINNLLLHGLISELQPIQINDYRISTIEVLTSLVKGGADLKEAMLDLNFRKDQATLKLTQSMFTNLRIDEDNGIVWSCLSGIDMTSAGVKKGDLTFTGRIPFNLSMSTRVAFVMYEVTPGEIWVDLESNDRGFDVRGVVKKYKPIGTSSKVTFSIRDKELTEGEVELLSDISGKMAAQRYSEALDENSGERTSTANDLQPRDVSPEGNPDRGGIEKPEQPRVLTGEAFSGDNSANADVDNVEPGLVVPPPVSPVGPSS